MSLKEYQRKRDFSKSPEPTGEEPTPRTSGKSLFFCVQKHLASHLHYDFRLEHDGVLLSWAVPKGPSLDPATKRLAMHVEDHPLAYGTFEGVIPEGYGAGIVMLWDVGTWTPEVSDVSQALEKGDLKFSLDGYKLKGSWALVRTRGWGKGGNDGRSWLLIKHRDEWAGDVDIATFAPKSVKSNNDLAEILAEDDPAIWTTNRPVTGGETGALLRDIIEKAAALKAHRGGASTAAAPDGPSRSPRTTTRATTPASSSPKRAATRTPPAKRSAASDRRKTGTTPRPRTATSSKGATRSATKRTKAR